MLSPRLTDCPECANIPSLLKKIDCKLAELGNNLYNNISYMLNKPIPAGDILQLIAYRRILSYKYCNPYYVHKYSVQMIASRVIRLTAGCVSKCNEPERCLEEPCDITVVLNPTTTSTTTIFVPTTTSTTTVVIPTTTTTSSTNTSTTTSTSSSTTTSTTAFPGTTTTTLAPNSCGVDISYDGLEEYPNLKIVSLAGTQGNVQFDFDALSVPDRFIVEWNNNVVIDTGYRGTGDFDFGGANRASFNSSLTGKIDPITLNPYPNYSTYPFDGYPRVTSPGAGTTSFNKVPSVPNNATVKVYAPMSGTAWSYKLYCPQ